jgi:chromosome segregation ATPase
MYEIEKQSLEAQVELCAERYRALETRLDAVDQRMDSLSAMLSDIHEKIDRMFERTENKWDRAQIAVIGIMATVIGALVARYVL